MSRAPPKHAPTNIAQERTAPCHTPGLGRKNGTVSPTSPIQSIFHLCNPATNFCVNNKEWSRGSEATTKKNQNRSLKLISYPDYGPGGKTGALAPELFTCVYERIHPQQPGEVRFLPSSTCARCRSVVGKHRNKKKKVIADLIHLCCVDKDHYL